ncbi:TerC family protein [Neomegalonema sp.]|uniref:TerC family protein n=1 Tax=Neomegalonema sp. TaxID=2039713 RepID=UPI0026126774|nr:TerC family protein [Neomegalonema sp.]MDD2867130.1 TerC family protein [Neomegalonema sp.]
MLGELTALGQVILIDLVLAADNAVVVGMAAAGVEPARRRQVVFWGIAAAVVIRIVFALLTVQLLQVSYLKIAGALLLLWVCWKMWREIVAHSDQTETAEGSAQKHKSFVQALLQVVVADVSMSLDNVLAVAGAAQDHTWVLVVGLVFSVALMGVAASFIADLLAKHRWIAWIGLVVILYVALNMLFHGWADVACAKADEVCRAYWEGGLLGVLKGALG